MTPSTGVNSATQAGWEAFIIASKIGTSSVRSRGVSGFEASVAPASSRPSTATTTARPITAREPARATAEQTSPPNTAAPKLTRNQTTSQHREIADHRRKNGPSHQTLPRSEPLCRAMKKPRKPHVPLYRPLNHLYIIHFPELMISY